jgi:hypothetical protein
VTVIELMGRIRGWAVASSRRSNGARHENLSADDAYRYPFDRDSLHFDAKTEFEDASAVAFRGSSWAFFQGMASVVNLTFDSVLPRLLKSNVKSKTTLESDIC